MCFMRVAKELKVIKKWDKTSYSKGLTRLLFAVSRSSEVLSFDVQAFPDIRPAWDKMGKFTLFVCVRFRILSLPHRDLLDSFVLHCTLGYFEGHEGTLRSLLKFPSRVYSHILDQFPPVAQFKVQDTFIGQTKASVVAYPTDQLRDSLVLARVGMESCLPMDFLRFVHFRPENHHVQFHPSVRLLEGSPALVRSSYKKFRSWMRRQVREGRAPVVPF